MATFSGTVQENIVTRISTTEEFALGIYPTVTGWAVDTDASGLVGSKVVDGAALPGVYKQYSGAAGKSFKDDLYNTVHVIPSPLVVGNIVNRRTFNVYVWNAYFSPQQLESVGKEGGEGLELAVPESAPTTYSPLEERTHVLTIYVVGPPTIDATYTFNFEQDEPYLSVSGSRAVLWPFPPHVDHPIREAIKYLTDVQQTRDGREQRMQLRSLPRREWEYTVLTRGKAAQWMDAILWGWQSRTYVHPIWTDQTTLQGSIPAGSTGLPCDTAGRDFTADGMVAIIDDERKNEVLRVSEVRDNEVALQDPTEYSWPEGSFVYPAESAWMSAEVSASLRDYDLIEQDVKFIVQELSHDWQATAPSQTHEGVPAVTTPVPTRNYSSDRTRRIDVQDNQTGRRLRRDLTGRPTFTREHRYVLEGRQAITDFRRLVYFLKGRYKDVWMPTWFADLTLLSDIKPGVAVVTVWSVGYDAYYRMQTGRANIAILRNDGTWFFRRVTNAAENDDGTQSLTLASSIDSFIAVGQVARFGWLERVRLEGDSVEIVWELPDLAVSEVSWRGIPE